MNKQTFYKVSEDMSMSLLDQLRQEGRLYYVSSSDELVQDAICDIMCKLRKTYHLCAPEYEDNMENIYRAIFSIQSIRERLIYKSGRQVRKSNLAFVAVILRFLVIRNSYLCNLCQILRVSFGSIDMIKNTNKKCYALSDDEEGRIKAILLNFSSRSANS